MLSLVVRGENEEIEESGESAETAREWKSGRGSAAVGRLLERVEIVGKRWTEKARDEGKRISLHVPVSLTIS